jgi:hypothetical protein
MDKQTDGARFAEIMTSIGEMYGKPIGEFTLDMWFADLKGYTIQQVWRAFQAHRKDPVQGKFMPKPADIVRHIDGLPDEKAVHAWAMVYKAISRVGSWGSVEFDDPAIHQAIDTMGGWIKLCSITIDELPFKQREFEKLYLQATKNKDPNAPKFLAGTIEIETNKQGLPAPPRHKFITGNGGDNRLLGYNATAVITDEVSHVPHD